MKTRILTIAILGLCLAAAPAAADWDHEVKWDQLNPGSRASLSQVNSSPNPLAADDFPCTETGWITDIEFDGVAFGFFDPPDLSSFRITFWRDVPATANEESHPGDLLADISVDPASPLDPLGLGWKEISTNRYKINLPRESWFEQKEGDIYWIGIQGVVGPGDFFGWYFRNIYDNTWGDDAAFTDLGHPSWWHWGWEAIDTQGLYEGTLPASWLKSADMSFKLTGTPIPEPGVFALAGLGLLALIRRRK